MIRNIENWHEYLMYKYGGKRDGHFNFEIRDKFSVSVPSKIIPEFKESLFNEVYFKYLPGKIYDLRNPVVLDIGANVGFFTILALFKLRKPKVISFEPIKRNFELLQQNLKPAKNENLSMVNKAVNDTKGELILNFDREQEITTSASLFNNQNGSEGEAVIATTLEDIFTEFKLSKIDILKLDCEGAEYNIIYNTPAQFFEKVNCITMETHQGDKAKENNDALAAYIKNLDFIVKTKQDDFIWAYKDPAQWI